MGLLNNILGTIQTTFSIGKGTDEVGIRTNSGTLQGRNNGGSWENILGQSGSGTKTITTKSNENYTVLTTDQIILYTTGSSDRTATLPAASGMTGKELTFKKVDSGSGDLIIDGNSSETIDGELTFSLQGQYAYITIISDGTLWHTIGGIGNWA